MSKAKWLLVFLIALGVAIPAQAVELTFGRLPKLHAYKSAFVIFKTQHSLFLR